MTTTLQNKILQIRFAVKINDTVKVSDTGFPWKEFDRANMYADMYRKGFRGIGGPGAIVRVISVHVIEGNEMIP